MAALLPGQDSFSIRSGKSGAEGVGAVNRCQGKLGALSAPEIIQVSAQRLTYEIGAGSVFALSDKIGLLKHCRWKRNQYLLGHGLVLVTKNSKPRGPVQAHRLLETDMAPLPEVAAWWHQDLPQTFNGYSLYTCS